MKIAITSSGNSPESKIDSRFGRCSFIAIYDKSSGNLNFIENTAKDSSSGAGPATAKLVADAGVSKVVALEFGGKVKSILDALNIEMHQYSESEVSVSEIITQLN